MTQLKKFINMDRMSTKGQMIDQIDLRGVPHSGFDRSNHNYGTGKLGAIIPVRLDEVYPGDRIKGNPEMVVNFEPLAAPLMGSMVLKQESFFVPYPQLWRHAYKFFTGKNGFNDPMPSESPFAVFDLFYRNIFSPIFSDTNEHADFLSTLLDPMRSAYSDASSDEPTISNIDIISRFKQFVDSFETILEEIYGPRKMLDLVQPSYKQLHDLYYNSRIAEIPAGSVPYYNGVIQSKTAFDVYATKFLLAGDFYSEETADAYKKDLLDFGKIIAGYLRDFFLYFFGPSSIFDYLGWPTVVETNDPETGEDAFDALLRLDIIGFDSNYWYNIAASMRSWFSSIPLSFMPFKAYYLIWYWNYRDQLLETGILDPEDDEFLGSNISQNVIWYCTILRQRCWFKDTFTTALTNTGDGNLLVPADSYNNGSINVTYWDNSDHELDNVTDHYAALAAGATLIQYEFDGISYKVPMNYLGAQTRKSEKTDDEANTFISLDLFDRIKRLRSFVQKRLILGYEVDDVIWSSFMVRLSNVRMHIPEILGRGRDAVQINTIVNNTSTEQQIAGDKTATAWAHGKQSDMNYFAEEWGLFLTFTTVMPIQSYAGGMQRLYLKRDRFDFMWPEFATMGMDAVYNCELAAFGTRLTDIQGLQVFGYQGRYYDLKSRLDEEHGRLLTDLNYLTFSREWDKNNPPRLNYIFVHCWPRLDGFVVESPLVDVFRYDCYNAHAWERRLPVPSEIVG